MIWLIPLISCVDKQQDTAFDETEQIADSSEPESAPTSEPAQPSSEPASAPTAEPSSEPESAPTSEPPEDAPVDCSADMYTRAWEYAQDYPLRDGGSWVGWCASLMWRFGDMPESSARPSAIIAYGDSTILGTDYRQAPVGAFHWWDIGEHGHVAIDLNGGGGTLFMGSSFLIEEWGTGIGVTSMNDYNTRSFATYLGWSLDYAGFTVEGAGGLACDTYSTWQYAGTIPFAQTEITGVPNDVFYVRLQLFASFYGYTGPIDGVPGTNTWNAVQRGFQNLGYEVAESGSMDAQTQTVMQLIAQEYGYTGPVDGVLGPNSYRGFSSFLNRHF